MEHAAGPVARSAGRSRFPAESVPGASPEQHLHELTTRARPSLVASVVVATLYLAALGLADANQLLAAAIWLPLGIAAGLAYRFPGNSRTRSALTLAGVSGAGALVLLATAHAPRIALVVGLGTLAGAGLAAMGWRAFGSGRLGSTTDVVTLLGVAAAIGLVGEAVAQLGGADQLVFGQDLPPLSFACIITSALVCQSPWLLRVRAGDERIRVRRYDALVAGVLLVGSFWLVFLNSEPGAPGLLGWPYMVLLGLIWLALRTGRLLATCGNAVLGLVLFVATVGGSGPFARAGVPLTQTWVPALLATIVFASVVLLVAVALADREELIHALRQQGADLAAMADHDSLTGLLSRSGLLARLPDLPRGQGERWTGLILMDLDGFTDINDTAGHDVGDSLLAEFATRLRGSVRADDLLARYGGDEFLAILPNLGHPDLAQEFANRILFRVRGPALVAGRPYLLSSSAGVIAIRDDAEDLRELLRLADVALYEAKRNHRGEAVRFDDHLEIALKVRVQLEKAVIDSITAGAIEVAYQPIVELAADRGGRDRVTGAEALSRLRTRSGLVRPDQFIPFAESAGLVTQLDLQVAARAMRQLLPAARSDPGFQLNLNISSSDLADPHLPASLTRLLMATGFPAGQLVLEVTESSLATTDAAAAQTLRELRVGGVRISLDDFGMGYSSLSRLVEYPVDQVKIDKLFVSGLLTDSKRLVVVRSILEIASDLGIPVVAEGVETPAQRDALVELGCPLGQGLLFGAPGAAEEIRPAGSNTLA